MRDDCCRSGRDMMMVAVRWNRLSVWPNDGCQLKHFAQARVGHRGVVSFEFIRFQNWEIQWGRSSQATPWLIPREDSSSSNDDTA